MKFLYEPFVKKWIQLVTYLRSASEISFMNNVCASIASINDMDSLLAFGYIILKIAELNNLVFLVDCNDLKCNRQI